MALALVPAASATTGIVTTTTLSAQSGTQACPTSGLTTTLTTLTVTVAASGNTPSGTVNILDNAAASPAQIASATLNASGQATISLYLSNGAHTLQAVYAGNPPDAPSPSLYATVNVSSQCTAPFAVTISSIAPATSGNMTLTPGESGTAIVTVTPSEDYVASLGSSGAPGFVEVSCSGLPSLASCTFTPQNLEILPGQDAGATSSMLIQTQAQTTGAVTPAPLGRQGNPVAWAILLPGMIGLGGIAWGARRRRWLQRLSLIALVALVTTLGASGCSPLWYYYNHGPGLPLATPTGTFVVTVAGQSSNGVTAITNSTTMTLIVQ